jgi:ankyrin repeat protein
MSINLIDQEIINIFFKFYKKELQPSDEKIRINLLNKISNNIANLENNPLAKDLILQKFSDYNFSFFHVVAKFGSPEDLKKTILIIGIKNIEQTDINNYTALHHSSISGRIENVKILIGYGANISARSSDETRNWCPIHYACKFNFKNIVEEFILAKIDKEIKTSFGLTPLHVACEYGHPAIVKYLVSIGCDLNPETIPENHCLTPLHYAIMINSIETTDILFNVGADFQKTTNNNEDALILATKRNFSKIVKNLINYGVVDKIETALEISIKKNCLDSRDIIKNYIEFRDKLFDKSNLIKFSKEFNIFLDQINPNNINEIYITLFEKYHASAHFLCNIKKSVGVLKKNFINLETFSKNNGLEYLAKKINHINEIIIHRKLSNKY